MSTSLFTKWWCGARGDGASSPAPAVRDAAGAEVPPVRYYSLDVLRGIAAFWVLLCHYPFSDAFRQALPRIVDFASFGHLGVQMFFVIFGLLPCGLRGANHEQEGIDAQFFALPTGADLSPILVFIGRAFRRDVRGGACVPV